MPPKRCYTWTSAGATTCITRYGPSSSIVMKTLRLLTGRSKHFGRLDSNRSARRSAARALRTPRPATGRPLMPNAWCPSTLRRPATPRKRERSGCGAMQKRSPAKTFRPSLPMRSRSGARLSIASCGGPGCAGRAGGPAASVHAWISRGSSHEAFARAVIRSRCPDSFVGRNRVRSSSCAMSADRWNATRACSCTSSTRSRAGTRASRRSCSQRV